MFSNQDKLEYMQYLRRQIKEEKKKPESITKHFNLTGLFKDLTNMENEYTTTKRQAA